MIRASKMKIAIRRYNALRATRDGNVINENYPLKNMNDWAITALELMEIAIAAEDAADAICRELARGVKKK